MALVALPFPSGLLRTPAETRGLVEPRGPSASTVRVGTENPDRIRTHRSSDERLALSGGLRSI